MKVHILSLRDILDEYTPKTHTYVVSITGSTQADQALQNMIEPTLKNPLYTVHRYTFDDITPKWGKGLLLNQETARAIITDFATGHEHCQELVVHCFRGKNRSPAVAMALVELFGLDADVEALKRTYDEANLHVYNLLKEEGRKILEKKV